MNRRSQLLGILTIILSISCKEHTNVQKDEVKMDTVLLSSSNLIEDTVLSTFYKSLSGSIADTSSIQPVVSGLSDCWKKMDESLLSKLAYWKQNELVDECKNARFILYPFSGPDFIIPDQIFSQMNAMVMFGLEPTGTDISNLGMDLSKSIQPKMQKSIRDYIGKSYFITRNMIADLKDDTLKGVTPLIASFIARSGYKIHSIKNYQIGNDGLRIEHEHGVLADSVIAGVEILYFKERDTAYRKINYLSFNATNDNLLKTKGVLPYLNQIVENNCVGYLKSASYLLHYSLFSNIRDLCFSKCNYILQDDTGIPMEDYTKNNWELTLWGEYTKPISDFRGVFQKDLDSLYKSRDVKPLPFSMGYHYLDGKQNLILAHKLK